MSVPALLRVHLVVVLVRLAGIDCSTEAFALLDLLPTDASGADNPSDGAFALDYAFVLNVVFLTVTGVLIAIHIRDPVSEWHVASREWSNGSCTGWRSCRSSGWPAASPWRTCCRDAGARRLKEVPGDGAVPVTRPDPDPVLVGVELGA